VKAVKFWFPITLPTDIQTRVVEISKPVVLTLKIIKIFFLISEFILLELFPSYMLNEQQ